MGKIYACCNRKGGAGKTATTMCLSSCLARKGYRVLAVDTDPQGDLTAWTDFDCSDTNTTLQILTKQCEVKEAVFKRKIFDIIPADYDLDSAETALKKGSEKNKFFLLKSALTQIQDEYDFVIIDTPPNLGILTMNALVACDGGVIIPTDSSKNATRAVKKMADEIKKISEAFNPEARVLGILLTRFIARYQASKMIYEFTKQISEEIGAPIFDTIIGNSTIVSKAQIDSVDLYDLPERNIVKDNYLEFTEEFLTRIHEQ